MLEEIKEIDMWDLTDTKWEPDGYDQKQVADISAENLQILIDRHNELVRVVNNMAKMMIVK